MTKYSSYPKRKLDEMSYSGELIGPDRKRHNADYKPDIKSEARDHTASNLSTKPSTDDTKSSAESDKERSDSNSGSNKKTTRESSLSRGFNDSIDSGDSQSSDHRNDRNNSNGGVKGNESIDREASDSAKDSDDSEGNRELAADEECENDVSNGKSSASASISLEILKRRRTKFSQMQASEHSSKGSMDSRSRKVGDTVGSDSEDASNATEDIEEASIAGLEENSSAGELEALPTPNFVFKPPPQGRKRKSCLQELDYEDRKVETAATGTFTGRYNLRHKKRKVDTDIDIADQGSSVKPPIATVVRRQYQFRDRKKLKTASRTGVSGGNHSSREKDEVESSGDSDVAASHSRRRHYSPSDSDSDSDKFIPVNDSSESEIDDVLVKVQSKKKKQLTRAMEQDADEDSEEGWKPQKKRPRKAAVRKNTKKIKFSSGKKRGRR
ncbi:hypothetical protein EJ04DRAFT_565553 [Polyplosphaeria fusca]|uniref:Uncharacterized protein n=1 Tax=Polyplosphaeria fusca TaxID=682080 RepID=A0A9P4QXE5_9PLEO|nr:hypothetical protein EJ04DRAFT_565553 [Polyplosphaeria fusca]